MWQAIIELVSNLVTISGNDTVDTVLFIVIGLISFNVAWGFVGNFFDFLGFYDSELMSGLHWAIRSIIFVSLTYILVKFFQFVAWILSFPLWVYFIITIGILIIVMIIYYINYKINLKKNSKDIKTIDQKKSINIERQPINSKLITYNKHNCPRCNSKLVQRRGPYGLFVGCTSYPNCNYSRKRF